MTLTPVNSCSNFQHLNHQHQVHNQCQLNHDPSNDYQPFNYFYEGKIEINRYPPHMYEVHSPPGYKYIRSLGKGSYGRVELYEQSLTGEFVAIKHINKNLLRTHRQLDRVRREVRILSLLEHPHIIKLKQVIETNDSIFMILEYVPHGELFEFISSRGFLTNMESLVIFRQLISALAYCHANCIIHRDLKPENILLSRDLSIKVADFGFGAVFGHVALLSTFCGSPHYAAPEMLTGTPYSGPEVDIWSVGVILYVLLTGKLPPSPLSFTEFKNSSLCKSSTELIRHMLCPDPRSRAKLSEILAHPWVTSVDSDLPYSFIPYRETITLKNLNQEILSYLCLSGYDKENILQLLLKSDPHPLKAEYYLLMERKKFIPSNANQSSPCKQPSIARRASIGQLPSQDRSSSPVRKLLTRMSSMFTSSPTRHQDNLIMPLSLFQDKPMSTNDYQQRRNSLPILPVHSNVEHSPFHDTSQYSSSSFSLNSRTSLLAPRRMAANSATIYLGPISIYQISSQIVSFLNEIGMFFSVRDTKSPFKLWCENRQKEGDFPPFALTIEVVEIINVVTSNKTVYGLECRRLCGGSWVVFRKFLTHLGKHMSSESQNEETPL